MGQYDDVIFRLAVDSRPYERSLINAVHSAFSFAGKVSAALSQPGKTLSQLGHTIGKGFGAFKGALGELGLGLGAYGGMHGAKEIVEYAKQLREMSENLGVSTDELQKWQYAAQMTGIGAEKSAKALETLSFKIAEAADPASKSAKFFQTLGISIENANGAEKNTIEIAKEVADAIQKSTSATERLSIAKAAFGKAGGRFVAMLAEGSDGLKNFAQQAERSFFVISDENIERMHRMALYIEQMGGKGAGGNILGGLIGQIEKISRFLGAYSAQSAWNPIKGLQNAADVVAQMAADEKADAADKTGGDAKLKRKMQILELQAELEKTLKEYRLDSMSDQEKLNQLQDERSDINAVLLGMTKEQVNGPGGYKALIDLAKIDHEIAQQKLKVEEKQTREKEKQKRIQERQKQLDEELAEKLKDRDRLYKDYQNKFADQFKFTFEDLLKGNPVRGNFALNRNIYGARQADYLMNLSRQASAWGRDDIAWTAASRANAIKSSLNMLKSDERNPWQSQIEAVSRVEAEVAKINTKLATLDKED